MDILFYYGGESLSLSGRHLVVPAGDGFADQGRKTIATFEYLLANREFDMLFRTNLSSYVDLPNLRARVEAIGRRDGFYSGFLGMRDTMPFASGSGYFLSRDLVELVVRNQSDWRHKLVDDQAIAELLSRFDVTPEPAPRQDFRRLPPIGAIDTTQYHIRCRTDSWLRIEDALIMRRIHRAFARARGLPAPALELLRSAGETVVSKIVGRGAD